MKQMLGIWKCECCNFSNPIENTRCSYCDLPKEHTAEQLEKYKQALPEFRRLGQDENIFKSLLFSFIEYIFQRKPQATVGLILIFMLLIPAIRDMAILLPIGLVVSILIWGYFYMKNSSND